MPANSADPVAATRFAATVTYDGTALAGSQIQPGKRTAQGELERAAAALFGVATRVEMAGRTDAGVHAIGQVAAFSAVTRLDAATVGRALNAHLPADVAVRAVRPVPGAFDPRRWARRRTYRYTIWNARERSPLHRRVAWHVEGELDLAAMDLAAGALAGRRDFIACSGRLEEGRTSVRSVFRAGWRREGDILQFDIEADAFLPQMVRRLTGALVRVGRGSLTEEEFVRLVAQAEQGTVGPTAPPHGLCLLRIEYDEGYTL
jgi:tRNA pseudouridine38-40 synthase